jgi:hypothetical protein
MLSVQALKRIDQRCRSKCVRGEPATRIQKENHNHDEERADDRKPSE